MNLKEKIFLFVRNKIDKPNVSLFDFLFKTFLIFISFFNRFFVFLKNLAYDLKILKPFKVGSRVISIGNIVAGGTGKTPFTLYLAGKFLSKGYKVAVVSRGYGAKKIKRGQSLCLNERDYSSKDVGDEPCLISRKMAKAHVIVGKDKIRSAKMAETLGCDIILLDDGFQSRKLHRDLDIVLFSSDSPLSNGHFLPGGLLREPRKSLTRADLAVFTDVRGEKGALPFPLSCPVLYSRLEISGLIGLSKEAFSILSHPKKIAIFCAIGRPESFYNILSDGGYEIVEKSYFFDHSSFDPDFLKAFSLAAKEKGAKALVCTEKDRVKLPENISLSLPLFYVQLEHKIIVGEEKLEELLQLK